MGLDVRDSLFNQNCYLGNKLIKKSERVGKSFMATSKPVRFFVAILMIAYSFNAYMGMQNYFQCVHGMGIFY